MDNQLLITLAGFLVLLVVVLCIALRHAMSIDTRNTQNDEVIRLLKEINTKLTK